jgi:hypothetical protein
MITRSFTGAQFLDHEVVNPKVQATEQRADGLAVGFVVEKLDGRLRVNIALAAV